MSTLTEQVDAWLNQQTSRKLARHTEQINESALRRRFLKWCDGERITAVRQITVREWNLYREHLLNSLAPTSVATYLTPVKSFLKDERIDTTDFTLPRRVVRQFQPLEDKEYRDMLDAATEPRDKLLIRLLWSTGMRVGELVGLERGSFIEKGPGRTFLHVRQSRERDVPVNPELWAGLRDLAKNPSLYVFAAPIGDPVRPLTANAVRKVLIQTAEKAKLNRIRGRAYAISADVFRDTFVIRWLKGRNSVMALQTIRGDRNLLEIGKVAETIGKDDGFDEMMALERGE